MSEITTHPTNFEHKSLIDYPLDEIASVVTHGFSGYFVPITVTKNVLLAMIRQYGVDLAASYMICADGSPMGTMLVGRRGGCSRVATMSVLPDYRGTGAGSYILNILIRDAHQRGEHSLVLEVIEQNEPALHLYQKFGFATVRRLVGYVKEAEEKAEAKASVPLQEIEMTELARNVLCHGPADLPWQISGETLCNFNLPQRAYKLEAAYLALSDPERPEITIHSILVSKDARGRGQARRILAAARARFQNKKWKVPAICPEEYGGLFEKLGFTQTEITQFQMMLNL